MRALEAVPVVSKSLFEEVPGRRSCCSHQAASLPSVGWWVIALFYHIPSLTSTPSAVWTRGLPHFAHPCATGTAGQSQNGKSYAIQEMLQAFGRGARYHSGNGVAVFPFHVREQTGKVALHALSAGRAAEKRREGCQVSG